MLILTRRTGETIVIGGDVFVTATRLQQGDTGVATGALLETVQQMWRRELGIQVSGQTLKAILEYSALSPPALAATARAIAEGLREAHRCGVFHRAPSQYPAAIDRSPKSWPGFGIFLRANP